MLDFLKAKTTLQIILTKAEQEKKQTSKKEEKKDEKNSKPD